MSSEHGRMVQLNARPRDWVLRRLDSIMLDALRCISAGHPIVICQPETATKLAFLVPCYGHSRRPITAWSKRILFSLCRFDHATQMLVGTTALSESHAIRYPSLKQHKSFAIFLRVVEICYEMLANNVVCTKRHGLVTARDIYYKDMALFGSQAVIDKVIDELSRMLTVPRSCLNIIGGTKGFINGAVRINLRGGSAMDCSAAAGNEYLIPSPEQIEHIETWAECVLVVEKEAIFQYLLSADLTTALGPCVIVTGKGYPDVSTRYFLRYLSEHTCCDGRQPLPILGLMDGDPYGSQYLDLARGLCRTTIAILHALPFAGSVFTQTTCEGWLSHTLYSPPFPSPSPNPAFNLLYSLNSFHIDSDALVPLSYYDRKKALELIRREYILERPEWGKEISKMLHLNRKAELECLVGHCGSEGQGGVGKLLKYVRTKVEDPELWL
ncbi:uncharacterized protein VTP21DRAFT_210 [Calcarisporiella thermophila]|uniref:uncharacterized protein n=1 Tax=Calcarisporiella thermophila TaxID=911321 RepID=UPI00374456D5